MDREPGYDWAGNLVTSNFAFIYTSAVSLPLPAPLFLFFLVAVLIPENWDLK